MRDYFNIWTRGFLKHITPVLLVRSSLATQPGELASNSRFEILPKQRKAKDDESVIERRVTYLPLPTTTIVPTDEGFEDWEIFKGKDGSKYDPKERLDCEILVCFLRHGLSAEAYDLLTNPAPVNTRKKSTATGKTKANKARVVVDEVDDCRESSSQKPSSQSSSNLLFVERSSPEERHGKRASQTESEDELHSPPERQRNNRTAGAPALALSQSSFPGVPVIDLLSNDDNDDVDSERTPKPSSPGYNTPKPTATVIPYPTYLEASKVLYGPAYTTGTPMGMLTAHGTFTKTSLVSQAIEMIDLT